MISNDQQLVDAIAVAHAAGLAARQTFDGKRKRNPQPTLEEAGQKAWSNWLNESENTRYGSINFDAFRDGFGLPRFGR